MGVLHSPFMCIHPRVPGSTAQSLLQVAAAAVRLQLLRTLMNYHLGMMSSVMAADGQEHSTGQPRHPYYDHSSYPTTEAGMETVSLSSYCVECLNLRQGWFTAAATFE